MDASLKLALIAALAFFILGVLFVEALKAARNGGLKHSEADLKAQRWRAFLGMGATLCQFAQLVMLGWVLLIVQTLIQRP